MGNTATRHITLKKRILFYFITYFLRKKSLSYCWRTRLLFWSTFRGNKIQFLVHKHTQSFLFNMSEVFFLIWWREKNCSKSNFISIFFSSFWHACAFSCLLSTRRAVCCNSTKNLRGEPSAIQDRGITLFSILSKVYQP